MSSISGGAPILYVVVPCYNEEEVLPLTSELFKSHLVSLQERSKISSSSRILFVDDGSTDSTWDVIRSLSAQDPIFKGISLSRNQGHQRALMAGLMESRQYCDISISIDADGQDDPACMESMVDAYLRGCEIVYGVRDDRSVDSLYKRGSARIFYRLMSWLGVETIYDHADFRLLSKRVLDELARFKEVNLYLRGMIPLVGFTSTSVSYQRRERLAGKGHYPFSKMFGLAVDGITSLSTKPIRCIGFIGLVASLIGLAGIAWAVIANMVGITVSGWASTIVVVSFFGGIQTLSLGVIGEYVGKTYLETKERPRYIVSERTDEEKGSRS